MNPQQLETTMLKTTLSLVAVLIIAAVSFIFLMNVAVEVGELLRALTESARNSH